MFSSIWGGTATQDRGRGGPTATGQPRRQNSAGLGGRNAALAPGGWAWFRSPGPGPPRPRVRPFAAASLRLAGLLQADVLSALNAHGWDIPDGGVAPDSVLGSAGS